MTARDDGRLDWGRWGGEEFDSESKATGIGHKDSSEVKRREL